MALPIPTAAEQPTMTIEEARVVLRLSRSSAYDAARSGDLPTIRIGRRLLVPTACLRHMLGLDGAAMPQDA